MPVHTPSSTPVQKPEAVVNVANDQRDATPPDDHEDFSELQQYGFRAMKAFAAKRRKTG